MGISSENSFKKTLKNEQVIEELTKNHIDSITANSCEDDTWYLDQILRYGFKGFNNFSNEELEQEYSEIFNEEIQIID